MHFRTAAIILILAVALGLATFKLYAVYFAHGEGPIDRLSLVYPFSRIIIDKDSPENPWAKEVADMDGDGIVDLLVAGSQGPLVMYRNGVSARAVISDKGSYRTQSGIAVGDIDNDGDMDIAFGAVWLENPRPHGDVKSVWAVHSIGAGNGNHNIELTDLNRDGVLDIVMRGETDSLILILIHESGGYWSMRTLDSGVGRNGLAVKDLNGDTYPDIVVPGVWLENPLGNVLVKDWKTHLVGTWNEYAAIDVGDMDQDGKVDIVMAVSEQVGKIAWFKNPGDAANHWEEYIIDEGPVDSAHALRVADMDGDGRLDVVTSEFRGAGRLLVYHQKSQPHLWVRQVVGTPALHNITVGDLDGDSDSDIAGTITFGKGNVEVWENRLTTLGLPQETGKKILIFWKTDVAFHESISDAIRAIRAMAQRNSVAVDDTSDAHMIEDGILSRYKAVILLSTQGKILNPAQKDAFEHYIRSGGGFVGIHSAADTEPQWPWYVGLIGTRYGGSHSDIVRGMIRRMEGSHASTKELPESLDWVDEWYNFSPNPKVNGATILLTLDESSYQGGAMGGDHPIAWYHPYDGGRAWYTAGGANKAMWKEQNFLEHVWGGIQYAAQF